MANVSLSCGHVTVIVLANNDRNFMKCHVKERELDHTILV